MKYSAVLTSAEKDVEGIVALIDSVPGTNTTILLVNLVTASPCQLLSAVSSFLQLVREFSTSFFQVLAGNFFFSYIITFLTVHIFRQNRLRSSYSTI